MFPVLVAVLLAAPPRPSQAEDLAPAQPAPRRAEWDPGPQQARVQEARHVAVSTEAPATTTTTVEPPVVVDAQPSEADRLSQPGPTEPSGQGEADGRGEEQPTPTAPGEQRTLDIPLTAGDSAATASEVLPVPAPLSIGGRGPPMTLSLEDMDYLTILRPPQPPRATPSPPKNTKRKSNGIKQSAKTVVKTVVKPAGGKTKQQQGKGRPKAPPYGPPPHGPPPPDSYAAYMGYDSPPPYGYGYGAYPRYPDPVMTLEYQQATSYPEEERFRPLPPPRPPAAGASATLLSSPTAPPAPASSPMSSSSSPLAPTGAPTSGPDPYMAYHNRDYQSGAPLATQALDQRPAGALQVTQSVQAAEHHSTSTLDLWHGSAAASAGTSPAPAAAALGTATARKATLKDILAQDCPGAEELGYCDSPPRYPMQQVSEAIERCSQLLDHMYAPPPEDRDAEGDTEGEGACQSVRRSLRPGYVRDVSSGRWLVALQARGRVVQKVSVERCTAPGRACARLADSKCARNLGFRNGARSTSCDQRTALVPVLTWDPEAPAACPRLRMARFPVACVCRML